MPTLFRFLLLAVLLPLTFVSGNAAEDPVAPPPRVKLDVAPAPRVKPGPIDVVALLRTPGNEATRVARRYETDRGALTRTYTVTDSAVRIQRFQKFDNDWLAALNAVDFSKVSTAGREELLALKSKVEDNRKELNRRAADVAEIGTLVPFLPTVTDLEESRRAVDRVDSIKSAGKVDALRKQVEKLKAAVDKAVKAKDVPTEMRLTKWSAGRAAEATTALRANLKTWHGFYTAYDPEFTWWLAEPYRTADLALGEYAKSLTEAAKSLPDSERPPAPKLTEARASDPSDAPDLAALLASPRSEFAGVLSQYGGGFGRGGGGRTPSDPSRWLAGLKDVDFDELSRPAKADYLLFKVQLERELKRQELRQSGAGRPPVPKDDSGITGRPIGRDALQIELAGELIPMSPEELIAIANKELAWCDAEMLKASRELGFGDDWRAALEKVKQAHVKPGDQPKMIRELSDLSIDYLKKNSLVTVPALAEETWRMIMMTPERQLQSPFFTGGEVISVAFPTNTMSHEAKLQSLRGNNYHFSLATVHHELIPGHHLQGFMNARWHTHRGAFGTPFSTEGWALYWELLLYEKGFPKAPMDRIGFLTWRKHRCCRIIFSLGYHLGDMTPRQCIDLLVDRVGFEPENATAEVRRSFGGAYGPLYQAAYLLGGFQYWELRKELVGTGKMTDRQFHDAILKEHSMPVAMVRALLTDQPLRKEGLPPWRFDRIPELAPMAPPGKGR